MEFASSPASDVAMAARFALDGWNTLIGAAGMAAMRTSPGLVSVVDQHAAEIRELLADPAGQVRAVSLAAYADGVADTAGQRGWDPVEAGGDWSEPSWPLVRLLAVCMLANKAG